MKNTLKPLKINIIADNEKLKEKTYYQLLDMIILLEEEYSRIIPPYRQIVVETINGKECKFYIYTSLNQFSHKRSLFYDSMKHYDSSYVIFELSDKNFWDELKTLIETTPDVV